ncbi:DNA repair ATPase [Cerasicoccus arenae]|uniref:ATPase AAA n=1 Tax=Cerasicoccus arenae TaxID=424488 RepID=A0A8J3DFA0_9BACT|nr:DNA repair ATPase [Cerasicoccus arenae]MBK1856794.1 DNA repair ATPase [Cerasicoccus arenae]GHB99546.1 ATPase AAA [Cerasicoccus arenae]
MADTATDTPAPASAPKLEGGAYEVIRQRLDTQSAELLKRLQTLNINRQSVFGAIENKLIATDRITTEHNCTPRDMVSLPGGRFLFGYNVKLGLKSQMQIGDVFAAYRLDGEDQSFHTEALDIISNQEFQEDFAYLYKYYKATSFVKFLLRGHEFYMAFRISDDIRDIKVFKWLITDDGLNYLGNRFDPEYTFPPQHSFTWTRAHREMQRSGQHPHISIEDKLFVETVGGDLTIKIEDNTTSGEGIYSEPVDHVDQTLDDADIFYAVVGELILLRILPYQEKKTRYFIYNSKVKEVRRSDAIGSSCVALPEEQGVIFANGYYLHSGECKLFDSSHSNMWFERLVKSPNGEDFLFSFYERVTGEYVLMSYNLIQQTVGTPIICHGFTIFDNGEMVYFRGGDEAQKHHSLQIWQTPFTNDDLPPTGKADSYLFKVGNKEVVRSMSECYEVYNLLQKDESYTGLYVDLVKLSSDILDTYFWLNSDEAANIKETLYTINRTAQSAIDEFDKVQRIRKSTNEQTEAVQVRVRKVTTEVSSTKPDDIIGFVRSLADLRTLRGEIIGLRDLRYANIPLSEELENKVRALSDQVAQQAVEFLLLDEALDPYRNAVEEQATAIEQIEKVTQANEISEKLDAAGAELELLIEIVGNLKIEDATQTTRIIDSISNIYSRLNQVRNDLKARRKELMLVEGAAQFNAQLKLLNQAVANYLDLCETPKQCDDYLTKLMVQLEELEGRYADFDEYLDQLTTKRDELYNAFETKKMSLQESRNRQTTRLLTSAKRILTGIENRAKGLKEITDINGYFASDLMVEKVRDIADELGKIGENLKGDDILGQLKTVQSDAIRQLKDKQELFVDGEDIIRFGQHSFSVNTQELALTTVQREGGIYFHLSGTQFFDPIKDEVLLDTRSVWEMEAISESRVVYRGEYLAYQLLRHFDAKNKAENSDLNISSSDYQALDDKARLEFVQRFMAPRYQEGYMKGVHDEDAFRILDALLAIHSTVGLLRYSPDARACGLVYWQHFIGRTPDNDLLSAKVDAFGEMLRLFPQHRTQQGYVNELHKRITTFCEDSGLCDAKLAEDAAEYLFHELIDAESFTVSLEAASLAESFHHELVSKRFTDKLEKARAAMRGNAPGEFQVLRDWIRGYALAQNMPENQFEYLDEAAAHLLRGPIEKRHVVDVPIETEITGLRGDHDVVQGKVIYLHYNKFLAKMREHEREVVPLYRRFQERKAELVDVMREDLRLNELKPRVMSAFVRNQLLDKVYLPMIGDNLAKQIGTAGGDARTDRMGMLLLISPPGYGKTTLMEYIANRLGITFVKVNGPAIGHHVTSLDPEDAPNKAAAEEVEKLNLAFEMGDNVMIYLDDIQHCNPELLQKFISLCDAQRKIEGVYKGKARTYDLKGRKVAVVMAGNPYTETGGKFQIPDMLANRADTYNLGDIIGGHHTAFEDSYLENSLTSNTALRPLSNRSRTDVYAVIKIAKTGIREGVEFEGSYSGEEVEEMVGVMKKMMRVRDTILRVNLAYIKSAAQADDFRTEPPFKLQGSYRNMNRIAEKLLPIMSDSEVESLIDDHYENEAQTLTQGAEANLLKFRQLEGKITPPELERWEEIKKRFTKNKILGGANSDPVNKVVSQLADNNTALSEGLSALGERLAAMRQPVTFDGSTLDKIRALFPNPPEPKPLQLDESTLAKLSELLPKRSEQPPTLALSDEAATLLNKLVNSLEKSAKPKSTPKPQADSATIYAEAIEKLGEKLAARPSVVLPKLSLDERTDSTLDQILEAFHVLFRHTGIEPQAQRDTPPKKTRPKKPLADDSL